MIVHLPMRGDRFGSPVEQAEVRALEERLEKAIVEGDAGEFDGDEFGENKCVLFMYGPDADRLFSVIQPTLADAPVASGGYAILRYGAADDPGAPEKRLDW